MKERIKLIFAQFFFRKILSNELAELAEKGFLVIPDFLSTKECDVVLNTLGPILNSDEKFIVCQGEKRLFGAERRTDNLSNTFQKLDNLSKLKLEPLTYLKEKQYTFMYNEVVADKFGSGGGWHRDSAFTPNFKIIIYLNDVEQDNGPFLYIKGSHKHSFYKQIKRKLGVPFSRTRFTEEEIAKLSSGNEIVELTGKKGTAVIAITNGLHSGKPVSKGSRFALTRYNFYRKVPDFLLEEICK